MESSTSVTATGRTFARVDQARQVRSKVNGIVFDQTDANQRTGLKRVITFTGLAELTKSMLKHMFQRPWCELLLPHTCAVPQTYQPILG